MLYFIKESSTICLKEDIKILCPSPFIQKPRVCLKETSQFALAKPFHSTQRRVLWQLVPYPPSLILLQTIKRPPCTTKARKHLSTYCVHVRFRWSCIQAEKPGLAHGFLGSVVIQAKCCVMGTRLESGSALTVAHARNLARIRSHHPSPESSYQSNVYQPLELRLGALYLSTRNTPKKRFHSQSQSTIEARTTQKSF